MSGNGWNRMHHKQEMHHEQKPVLVLLLSGFAIVLAWSAIHPHDYFTWGLEVFPRDPGAGSSGLRTLEERLAVVHPNSGN